MLSLGLFIFSIRSVRRQVNIDQTLAMARVIAYIDGFNLYFGLKSQGWERYLWLNVQTLAGNLLQPCQTLVHTKYFTARVGFPSDKVKRQATYLDALHTLSDVSIFYGRYQLNSFTCRNCWFVHQIPNEKMTDVNIAVELMQDAFEDRVDTALLISADSDLVGPVVAVQKLFPTKRVVVACPPGRSSVNLCRAAAAHFRIGRASDCQESLPRDRAHRLWLRTEAAGIVGVERSPLPFGVTIAEGDQIYSLSFRGGLVLRHPRR